MKAHRYRVPNLVFLAALVLSVGGCAKIKSAARQLRVPGALATHASSRVQAVAARPATAASKATFTPRPYDWPQWQGPRRTAISAEHGLLQSWPEGGPPLLWKVYDLGGGYSTPSVSAGRIFGMGFDGDRELVWALEEESGQELWRTRIAEANRGIGYNEGPRSTPTVDGELVFALGVSGDLVCLESATGKERWHKKLVDDFSGRVMSSWGYSESPLVDGDRVIATPGGDQATLVALDKKTGSTIWKASVPQGDGAGYASVIRADLGDEGEYVQLLGGGVVGVAAKDGRFLWRYDRPANRMANCSTPIYQDGCVFAASNYGAGGGLVRLRQTGAEIKTDEVYATKHMKNHHGGVLLLDGHLYGANDSSLACLDFKTGKVHWEEHKPGKGSVASAEGMLYYRNENGPVVLIRANPEKYEEVSRFEQPERSDKMAWPHPVLANGRLYIRDQGLLLCYDIKRPESH
jgi:outer membrane protein assembly factor BamB